jgi:ATP-dependent helicase/nuclease subunit A
MKVTTTEPPIQSKPVDLRQRRDLTKIVEKARQMAHDGEGRLPKYVGAIPVDAAARRHYSFSQLTGQLHARTARRDFSPLDADPSAQPPVDALGLGTLVHAVLAEVEFGRPNNLAALVRRHADEQSLLDGDRSSQEAVEMIGRFLASPRAAEMAAATEMHRELEFLLPWPPAYIEGFIDCLYCDPAGQWRLVDYKTNRVTADRLAATAAPYQLQMLVYALAVERILKRPPAELVLCFLRPGLEYHFTWDAAARQQATELITQAIRHPPADFLT